MLSVVVKLSIMTWLTVIEYLCQRWPRICSICRKHFPVLSSFMIYHRVCNTTGVTRGAETNYPSGAPEFTPCFSGVRVTRSLVWCVCFADHCLFFCSFFFGQCVVLLQFTDSDYPLGIFKPFLYSLSHLVLGISIVCNIGFNRKLNFYNALWEEKLTKNVIKFNASLFNFVVES